jgi:protein phosphatase
VERIAIIADIHGNIPALQAVFRDIQSREITRIFCLGDLIGKGPSSDLAVDLVRGTCEKVITGNWDEHITRVSDQEKVLWHQKILGEERLAYLSQLPFLIEFVMSGKLIRLFHASPRSVNERIQPWDSYDSRLSLFNSSDYCEEDVMADVVGYGDIHNAFIQNFNGKTLFNVGSVGNPLEITQSSYAILEGEYNGLYPSPFSVQLVRVPYDIELAVRQAIEAEMPDLEPYIVELRTGEYRGSRKAK